MIKMKKNEVIKTSKEFEIIIKKKQMVKNNEFIIYYKDSDSIINRFGISVSKKIGNAVIRNYYKRIIRNICDSNKKNYSKSKDYIIIMRNGCKELKYEEINKSFASLLKKVNKEKEQSDEKKD